MNDYPSDTLVTQLDLEEGFRAIGIQPGMCVIVHSSLRSLGWVCGGAVAVILALEKVLTDQGTLMMPTQSTDLSEPSKWRNPPVPAEWWPRIRETMPAFDPDLTPTSNMGVVPETFRKQRGVIRSNHPAVSFAARGKHARWLTADHRDEYGLGPSSPLGKLYELDGRVLLIGVGHDKNTSLHLAEYRADWPGKTFVAYGNPVFRDGARVWNTYEDLDHDDSDFETIGKAFEAEAADHSVVRLGKAQLSFHRQRPLIDFAVKWITQNR